MGLLGPLGVVLVVGLLAISTGAALLLVVLGASSAEVGGEGVRVRMGWVVDVLLPLSLVSWVRRGRHALGEGVGSRYDFNGGLALVSACHSVVEIGLHEPLKVEMRLFPWQVSLRYLNPQFVLWAERIKLSLREPEQFIEEVEGHLEASAEEASTGGEACGY
jgi:hypothetical protein